MRCDRFELGGLYNDIGIHIHTRASPAQILPLLYTNIRSHGHCYT